MGWRSGIKGVASAFNRDFESVVVQIGTFI